MAKFTFIDICPPENLLRWTSDAHLIVGVSMYLHREEFLSEFMEELGLEVNEDLSTEPEISLDLELYLNEIEFFQMAHTILHQGLIDLNNETFAWFSVSL